MQLIEILKKAKSLVTFTPAALAVACVIASLSSYESPVLVSAADDVVVVEESIEGQDAKRKVPEKEESSDEEETVSAGSFDLPDGTYRGSAMGYEGEIVVSVTIKDGKISAIDIISSKDDEPYFGRAKGLIDEILKKQSLDVDTISGATFSSRGVLNAVKNALTGEKDQSAKGSETVTSASAAPAPLASVQESGELKDGTYLGSAGGFNGPIGVRVTVRGGAIADISIVSSTDNEPYLSNARSVITSMLRSGSTNVDTVSGATYSSRGIILAVRNALSQARGSASAGSQNASDQYTANQYPVNQNPANGSPSTSQGGAQKNTPASLGDGKFPYKEGIYEGTGQGRNGPISLALAIQDSSLKAIIVTSHEEDEPYFTVARQILQTIVKTQNTDVDVMSGATMSSEGILAAFREALKEAQKSVQNQDDDPASGTDSSSDQKPSTDSKPSTDPAASPDQSSTSDETDGKADGEKRFEDGIYAVSTRCEPDESGDFAPYTLSMTVTIKDDAIVAIEDIKGDGDASNLLFINMARDGRGKPGVPAQIIAASPYQESAAGSYINGIDAISGATCSSDAIVTGCEEVLKQAAALRRTTR